MPTGRQVAEHLAPAIGIPHSTLDRLIRALRAADLVPAGVPGHGGKSSVHFEIEHLVMVFYGLAAYQPAHGPHIARSLARLPHIPTDAFNARNSFALFKPPPPRPTLGESLRGWMQCVADDPDIFGNLNESNWIFRVYLTPLMEVMGAQIEFGLDADRIVDLFGNEPIHHHSAAMQNVVSLSGFTLRAVSRMLTKIPKRRPSLS